MQTSTSSFVKEFGYVRTCMHIRTYVYMYETTKERVHLFDFCHWQKYIGTYVRLTLWRSLTLTLRTYIHTYVRIYVVKLQIQLVSLICMLFTYIFYTMSYFTVVILCFLKYIYWTMQPHRLATYKLFTKVRTYTLRYSMYVRMKRIS